MMEKLALQAADGSLAFTRRKVLAYFSLGPQRVAFRSEAEMDALFTAHGAGLARLVGRRIHVRVTTRPYPVDEWARTLDSLTPSPLPGWAGHLMAEQRHLLGQTLAEKEVYVGVEITSRRSPASRALGRVEWQQTREGRALESELRRVEGIMAGPGIDGRPVTGPELEWLLHRSVSLGMPAPLTLPGIEGRWEAGDLAELTDRVEWTCEPYGRTVRVAADVNGGQVVRHVAVLTVGRMAPLSIPGSSEPWQARTDRLPFPVEWSATYDVLAGERVISDVQSAMLRIRSQVAHFREEHNLDPPLSLDRQRRRALEVEDEMQSGTFEGLSTRTDGWYRIAVAGGSEEEALERAEAVASLYSPRITIAHPADQYRMAREFIPGEPLANNAYRRRMDVRSLAAGLPAATATVGDRRGSHLGYTSGTSERAVMFDPWYSQEVRERSGLTIIAGGLGAGKSTLLGVIVYKSARRGIRWTVLDPAGSLATLCDMPELRAHAKHTPLMNAAPGALNTYRVIPEPRADHYDSPEELERARVLAAAQRRALTIDVLSMLLPGSIAELPETGIALLQAVRRVGGSFTASPVLVIDKLRQLDGELSEHGRHVADFLSEAAEMPQAQLIFPAGYALDYGAKDDGTVLHVMSLNGITMPDEGSERKSWTIDESFSVALMHLAGWLAQRSIYGQDRHERKGVAIDEAHELGRTSSGRLLLSQSARNTRRHNVRAIYASQNVGDPLSAGIGNFVDSAFIGRTEDAAAQSDALKLLRIEEGVGYEKVLAELSPQDRRSNTRSNRRDFIFSDGGGGIERMRVDLAGTPELAAALDTTADPTKRQSAPGRRRAKAAA